MKKWIPVGVLAIVLFLLCLVAVSLEPGEPQASSTPGTQSSAPIPQLMGWVIREGKKYYIQPDGSYAKGQVEIGGKTHFFTSTGQQFYLVNPWNEVPEGYTVELAAYGSRQISAECVDALQNMLDDCKAAGHTPVLTSAYRTHEYQKGLFDRKVQKLINAGHSEDEARRLAAMEVAVPGTSEHQLGLAVDIVDRYYQQLDENQAKRPTQIWLMENCWRYGFILRYPPDCTEHTGIIYEPWHYRYVGTELAAELHGLGVCLEEYIQMLTEM